MSDPRNRIDCSKCHNDKCALAIAGKKYNVAACSGYKPLTHYDEIHSMNVEQLAEWIDESMCTAMWCDDTVPVNPYTKICSLHDCKACIVKWLESEVEKGREE